MTSCAWFILNSLINIPAASTTKPSSQPTSLLATKYAFQIPTFRLLVLLTNPSCQQFGYGLTYTTFSYSNLTTTLRPSVPTPLTPPSAPTTQGGNPTLFDVIATVSCTVTNTGTYLAAEVAQLYIGVPTGSDGEEQPEKVLRGFSKQSMDPGNSVTMEFNLTRRDLSVWDVVSQEWVLRRGEYRVMVGASVLDIRLEGTLTIQ